MANPTGKPLSQAAATQVGANILGQLSTGQFAAVCARFAPKLHNSLRPEALEQAWTQITTEAGKFQAVLRIQLEPSEAPLVGLATFTCAFERGQLLARMLIDPDSQLVGLWFQAKDA